MSELREFKGKDTNWLMPLIGGVVFLVLGVAGVMIFAGFGFFVFAGIIGIVLGVWNRGRSLITLHPDHLEMKVAPAAPRQLVLYSDMKKVDQKSDKKAFLLAEQDGKEKKLRLPLPALTPEEGSSLINELETRMKKM
ncbi:MAG: hypothetical protein R6V10_17125 [bacterium]